MSNLYPDYKTKEELRMPFEFKSLASGVLGMPYRQYMVRRGFPAQQIEWLSHSFDLRYCTQGPFKGRIIFPVYDRWKNLLTWTGRTIRLDVEPRYKMLSTEQAVCGQRDIIFGLPYLWGCPQPRVLFLCEGPFDAIKITTFGRSFGVHATCLFGLNMSMKQRVLVDALKNRFQRVCWLLDSAASYQTTKLSIDTDWLVGLDIVRLPSKYKDPGEMTPTDIINLAIGV